MVDLETTCPPHQIERQGDVSWQRQPSRDRKRNSSVKANCIQPIKHVGLLKHRGSLAALPNGEHYPLSGSLTSGCSVQWRALSSLRKSDIWLLCPMTTSRGVKNPQAVERNKKNQEMEKQEMRPSPPGGGGGLKVG
ncbi:uncharacterized protein LOC127908421 isoform X5 [Oncorhynchus keta]|uniref:uncharacterized protein LOC127908421 isoform X5 n=2 Tax=Oncorhynchus keta TaxID=8018 RepID=UPI00227A4108|nr:uncharacterized protein LOC127908421 isoform X5 [Oncorhynchus keta]